MFSIDVSQGFQQRDRIMKEGERQTRCMVFHKKANILQRIKYDVHKAYWVHPKLCLNALEL